MNSTVKFIEEILACTKDWINADIYDELTDLIGWVKELEITEGNFNLIRLVNFEPKSEIGKWTFHRILDDLKKLR